MLANMYADQDTRAARLALAIRRRGFKSYREAAARFGYKTPTLTSHANGTRGFDVDTAMDYAKKFKCDPLWLLGLVSDEGSKVIGQTWLPSPQTLADLLAIAMHASDDDHEKLADAQDYAHALYIGLKMLAADPASENDPGYLKAVRYQVLEAIDAARYAPAQSA